MTRLMTSTLGAMCALALLSLDATMYPAAGAIGVRFAEAGKSVKSVSRCVKYRQDQRDTAIEIFLDNTCERDLSCSMSWSLTCHREDGELERHRVDEAFELIDGTVHKVNASALSCGEDDWSISNVRWSCRTADE